MPHSSLATEAFSAKVALKTDLKPALVLMPYNYTDMKTDNIFSPDPFCSPYLFILIQIKEQQEKYTESSPKTDLKPATVADSIFRAAISLISLPQHADWLAHPSRSH